MLTVTGGHLGFIGTEGEREGGEGALGFMAVGEGRREKQPPAKRSPPPNSGVWAIRLSTQMPLGRFTHYNLSARRNGEFTRYNVLRESLCLKKFAENIMSF